MLFSAPRRQPLARDQGRQACNEQFQALPSGYFHIDIAEVRTEEGQLFLFVAIDRTSKFASTELLERAGKLEAAQFLRNLLAVVPSRIHTVQTDNGIQLTNRLRHWSAFEYSFGRVCREHAIEHRLTKPKHPWTNGQVEQTERTLREATVNSYYYEPHQGLKEHLDTCLSASTFARRLKTLQGLTPYEFIVECGQTRPERLRINHTHHMVGLNT